MFPVMKPRVSVVENWHGKARNWAGRNGPE